MIFPIFLLLIGIMAIVFFLILMADKYEQPKYKYRNDLEKQRKEKEEQRKIYADRDNTDGKWWFSGNVYPRKKEKPEIKRGKRGGRYTEDKTKDGRPYRRYF